MEHIRDTRRLGWALAGALATALGLSGCAKEGCLSGEATCQVPSPCPKVTFTCDATNADKLAVTTIASKTERPGGWNALGAKGDLKLTNGFVEVVLAGVGNQNLLDPNGGSLLDLTPVGQARDDINQITQVVGILPRDAAFYTSVEIIDERPARVAVQFKGTLDGQPNVPIFTRYELQPCDHGVRVRTELLNAGTFPQTFSLVDGYYWSGREALPFAPGPGNGFLSASFGLTSIDAAFRLFPYLAAAGHSSDDHLESIATASCTEAALEGFNSDQISAAGLPRTYVPPRGSLIFERFIAAAQSNGVSGAIDVALEVRRQVLGETFVTLTGKVERLVGNGTFAQERNASLLISEGTLTTPVEQRTPWTQIVPDATGAFTARVPAGKRWVVEAHSFGKKQVEREYPAITADTDLGSFVLPSTGTVSFRVTDDARRPIDAELFVVPPDDQVATFTGSLHGRFTTCSPWLGPPPGASPACNRILVRDGAATADLPLGTFDVYAYHGMFWSLAKQTLTITAATTDASFVLTPLPIKPTGAVSADLHVHGAASFDSSIPDYDRVLSFSASNLDVIISTDHDVIWDYSKIVKDLGLDQRMSTVTGTETTGHIPFLFVPHYGFPLVIGHYNFWPLKFDPSLPRNGGPFDERVEPGGLFERTKPLFASAVPMIELNHPWDTPEFGRDLGFPRAIFLDLTKNLPTSDDGTSNGVYVRTPAGSTFANDAHHAQEVMNGSENATHLQYRQFWFYVLNQGRLRTGTANSDSHSLTDNTVGMPQNLVFTAATPGPNFNIDTFNTALREGRSFGTNGPVIDATIEDASGTPQRFSLKPFKPKAGTSLKITVRSAPWVPVQEVRVIVNGVIKKTIANLPAPADPFAATGDFVRYQGEVALADLLPSSGDAWVVVEAGRALLAVGDLGGGLDDAKDGMPDTTDNNGDGVVDTRDVAAGQTTGPLSNPPTPKRGEVGYEYGNIANGGSPQAFTNPFVLDLDGDGAFTGPGVSGGN